MRNNKIVKKIAGLVSACLLVFSIPSCKRTQPKDSHNRVAGQFGYKGFYMDIPLKEGYTLYDIGEIFLDKDNYCLSAIYSHYDEEQNTRDFLTDILTIDMKGSIQHTLEITKHQAVRAVFEHEYAFFAYSDKDLLKVKNGEMQQSELTADLVFFDKTSGDTTRVIHPDKKADTVFTISDGFVLTGEHSIMKYSFDGVLLSSILTDFTIYPNGTTVFESDGNTYLLTDSGEWTSNYYKLDFIKNKAEYITDTDHLGDDVLSCSGRYLFGVKGEYKVDFANMQIQPMAMWNDIDIRPLKMADANQVFVAIDDTHFVQKTVYRDGTGDVGFFSYDSSINQNRTPIVIGGYDIYSDDILKWAVYNFNTKNEEYRVVLDDYADKFSYSTPQEAQSARLRLMKYFNEGNVPDVFYGDHFDYDYFGHAGMVLDLVPFFETDQSLKYSDLIPSIQDNLKTDGEHCYSVFSAFSLEGYYGLKSDFQTNQISLSNVKSMCQGTDKGFTCELSSPCIAVEAIMYNYREYWGEYGKEKTITRQEIEEFVSNTIDMGVDPSITWGGIGSLQNVYDGLYYLANADPTDLFSLATEERAAKDGLVFVGYPSINGSVHLITTSGRVGISSSTTHRDQCWDFVRELLLPDTQKKVVLSGRNPVNNEVFELMCNSALDPEAVSDQDMKRFVLGHGAVSKDVIDDYRTFIDSIDTIKSLDWGSYNIISEEIASYYTQNRSIEQIAETLDKRLSLYVQENYPC